MLGLAKEEIVKRNPFAYQVAKFISNTGYRFLSNVHLQFDSERVRQLKKENAVLLYTGLHKSLWETTGVLSAVCMRQLPIPYIGMGDNLVRGEFFQKMSARVGAFLVKRAKTRRDVIESSKKLKRYINYYMAIGTDVCIFPEGTRRNIPDTGQYGNFFPTVFDALLDYEKNVDSILNEYKELSYHPTYIIPFNVDYSKIREDYEIVSFEKGKPRTLHVFDSLKMLSHVGDVYVSFSDPIKTTDYLEKSRKELAVFTRSRCLELVKILPINIVSRAILDAAAEGNLDKSNIIRHITKNIGVLSEYQDRFRGFNSEDDPEAIFLKVAKEEQAFREPDVGSLPFYRLYAGFINHYYRSPE